MSLADLIRRSELTQILQHVVTALSMGMEFDLIKLAILVWFLAPFGYNASDLIFENVRYFYQFYLPH